MFIVWKALNYLWYDIVVWNTNHLNSSLTTYQHATVSRSENTTHSLKKSYAKYHGNKVKKEIYHHKISFTRVLHVC